MYKLGHSRRHVTYCNWRVNSPCLDTILAKKEGKVHTRCLGNGTPACPSAYYGLLWRNGNGDAIGMYSAEVTV